MPYSSSVEGLVEVDTALAVIKQVNLLKESNALALDIGGSLAKLLYLEPCQSLSSPSKLAIHRVGGSPARYLSVYVPSLGGRLHFFAFETRNIEQLLEFMHEHWIGHSAKQPHNYRCVRATGGGSYKYAENFESAIGIKLARLDEMSCVVAGLNFLLTSVNMEVYSFKQPTDVEKPSSHKSPRSSSRGKRKRNERSRPRSPSRSTKLPRSMENAREFIDTQADPFPYLLVNIGSGVSIVKVTGHGVFERVSGSSLGGGTFWGLARLLLNCKTFDDVISLTNGANNANVDMLVGDIYGGAYTNLGLDPDVIAASFGKVTMRKDQPHATSFRAAWRKFIKAVRGTFSLWLYFWLAVPVVGGILRYLGVETRIAHSLANLSLTSLFRPEDVALSLLRMVSYNIGQIAYLNARVHNLERIYFGGNFIRDHPYTIADISFAVNFWSSGQSKALFLRHDGYLGAIGAFLGGTSEPSKRASKAELGNSTRPRSQLQTGVAKGELNGSATDHPLRKLSTDLVSEQSDHELSKTANSMPIAVGENGHGNKSGKNSMTFKSDETEADLDVRTESHAVSDSSVSTENASAKKKSRKKKKKQSTDQRATELVSEHADGVSTKTHNAGIKPNPLPAAEASNTEKSQPVSSNASDGLEGEWQVVHHRRKRPPAKLEAAS